MKHLNESQTAQEPVATYGSETMLPVRVAEIMARDNPVTIDPETPISVASTKMLMNRFNSLPVVEENGSVLGIITSTDVLASSEKMVKELMRLRQR